MNAREKLLHNEVQHLSRIVQIVSFELTLVTDFMQEQFGVSYERFRAKYNESCGIANVSGTNSGLSSSTVRAEGRKSTAADNHRPAKQAKTARDPLDDGACDDGNGASEEEDITMDENLKFDETLASDDDLDDAISSNISITSVTGAEDIMKALVPEGAELVKIPATRPGPSIGKPRSDVWKHFVVSRFPNRKLHAACLRCKQSVSCKAERLTAHFKQCVLRQPKRKRRPKGDPVDIDSVAYDKKLVDDFLATTTQPEYMESADQLMNLTATGSEGRHGRVADPVWNYFTKTIDSATNKATTAQCKKCGMKVSPKVERVRRHFINCYELDREGDSDSMEPAAIKRPTEKP